MTRRKFCVMQATNSWTPTPFAWIHNVIIYSLESVWNFRGSIKKWHIPIICSFNYGHCKLPFSSITLHVRAAFKPQYMFVVGAKSFPANQNVKYGCSNFSFRIFRIYIILPVVYKMITHSSASVSKKKLHCIRYCNVFLFHDLTWFSKHKSIS